MTVQARVSVDFAASLAGAVDLGSTGGEIRKRLTQSFVDGVGAGQADRVWADTLSVAASSSADIDLAGALTDALGGSVVLARVKALLVVASPANTNNVVVGAAATNTWVGLLGATHTVTLRPGALFAVAAGGADVNGYAVTAGTGDILRVANSGAGTPVGLDIVIIGAAS